MANIRIHNHQGQPLPADWKAMAKTRAANAEASYLCSLENAWRSSHQEQSGSFSRDARLQPPSWNDLFGKK
jgi:hypothetical protein